MSPYAHRVLPEPPSTLPAAPRAFYDAVRAHVTEAEEVDFGDSGIGLVIGGGAGAQVSRRAAVVFTADATEHFDERTAGWETAAAGWLVARVA